MADPVLLPEPLHQVDQAPAHHPMDRRDRAVFDHLEQMPTMLIAQDRGLARRFAVQKAVGTLGIEAQDPVAQGLQPHATDLSGLGARAAVVDRRQRQQAAGLRPIFALARQRPQVVLRRNPSEERPLGPWQPPCLPSMNQTTADLEMPDESPSPGVV